VRLIIAACVLSTTILSAGGCDDVGAPEPIPLNEARANLIRFSSGSDTQSLCEDEGRRNFRRAVLAFSAAAHAAGEEAPSADVLLDDPAWRLVVMGVVTRLVRQSDLSGEVRHAPTFYELRSSLSQFGLEGDLIGVACREFMTFYSEATTYVRLTAEFEATDQRSYRIRGRLEDRLRQQAKRVDAAEEALKQRLLAAGRFSERDASLHRP